MKWPSLAWNPTLLADPPYPYKSVLCYRINLKSTWMGSDTDASLVVSGQCIISRTPNDGKHGCLYRVQGVTMRTKKLKEYSRKPSNWLWISLAWHKIIIKVLYCQQAHLKLLLSSWRCWVVILFEIQKETKIGKFIGKVFKFFHQSWLQNKTQLRKFIFETSQISISIIWIFINVNNLPPFWKVV